MSQEFEMNDKKVIKAWALFDWANSAYSLVISTAIFPIYYLAMAPDELNILGYEISDSTLYSFSISFAYILIALIAPILGGIADAGNKRLFFLRIFTTIGSISCFSLFIFTDESMVWLATALFISSTIGYAGSLIFYDAFLPVIATRDNYDAVSAKGYAQGYLGSVLLLIVILVISQFPTFFGIADDSSLPYRLGFAMVGLWWMGFGSISFRRLPQDQPAATKAPLWDGYNKLRSVTSEILAKVDLTKFLIAFFFYSAGVQTIIYLATIFADKELGFDSSELILTVVILQVVAIFGSIGFAKVAKSQGSKKAIIIMLLIWIVICLAAFFVHSKTTFYIIAMAVGLVLGGIQATSRACFSKLIEGETEHNSYFSYYDLLYYLSIVFGTFSFGVVESLTGSLRYSILILALFFVLALAIFSRVKIEG